MASEPAFYKHPPIFRATALFVALILLPREALGYIDPGTGSQLLQILAAGLLTALFFIKTIWRLILGWMATIFNTSIFKSKAKTTSVNQPPDPQTPSDQTRNSAKNTTGRDSSSDE